MDDVYVVVVDVVVDVVVVVVDIVVEVVVNVLLKSQKFEPLILFSNGLS